MTGPTIMLLVLYFLPVVCAASRNHRAVASIFIVNLFFGWTILGWVLCLAWGFGPNRNLPLPDRSREIARAIRELNLDKLGEYDR